ncbi:MAG: asparaginase [Candidatus Nanopelagicales bacterium]
MTGAQVLVETTRAGMVESQHRGHAVIVADDGDVVAGLGDTTAVVYPRSAVKPLQAAGMVQSGLDLRGSALALASSSHSGEPFHIEGVCAILQRAGLTEDVLRCPPDLPYAEEARREFLASGAGPQRVVMNCSGKHAAMLTTCVLNDWPVETYLEPGHPLQIHLREVIGSLAGAVPAPASTDGCGAPLWGLPLVALARAMVNVASDVAGSAVVEAMRQHPEYVGGTTRDVTHLMRGVPGLAAKDGAEAVQAMSLRIAGQRFGIAIKIEDGSDRARPVVAAATLARLGLDAPVITEHLRRPVLGGGRPVGMLRPSALLAEFAGM